MSCDPAICVSFIIFPVHRHQGRVLSAASMRNSRVGSLLPSSSAPYSDHNRPDSSLFPWLIAPSMPTPRRYFFKSGERSVRPANNDFAPSSILPASRVPTALNSLNHSLSCEEAIASHGPVASVFHTASMSEEVRKRLVALDKLYS